MRLSALSTLPLLLLLACDKESPVLTAHDWVARGDAKAESDPARAVANYEKARAVAKENGARNAPSDGELNARIKDAAARWLLAEIDRDPKATGDAQAAFGFVEGMRARAKDYGVQDAVAAKLDAIEGKACQTSWDAQRAEIEKSKPTPFDAIVQLSALVESFAKRCPAASKRGEEEVGTLRKGLVEKLERDVSAAGSRPSRLFAARLLAAARSIPAKPTPVPIDTALGRWSTIGWTFSAEGCERLDDAGAAARAAREGEHRGSLKLRVTCTANEGSKEIEVKKTRLEKRTETFTRYETQCSGGTNFGGPRVCTYRGTMGQCESWSGGAREPTCTKVPVKDERTVTVPITTTEKKTVSIGEANAKGTLDVEIDGRPRSIPVNVNATGSSKSSAQRELVKPLAHVVENVMREVQREIQASTVEAATSKMATADTATALDEMVVLLAGDVPATRLPAGPIESAARNEGLSKEQWMAMAIEQRPPSSSLKISFGSSTPGPSTPSPDEDGLALERERRKRDEAASNERSDLRDADESRGGLALGATTWQARGGGIIPGITAAFEMRGGGGGKLPFYFYDATVGLEAVAAGALGTENLLRVGGGARTTRVWLAPYVVGGASGRSDADTAGLHLPLGIDAGFGARAVAFVGSASSLELFAERISRPLKERGDELAPVLQRIRYELRYVARESAGDDIGFGGSCSFHQQKTDDVVFPTSAVARSCDLRYFFSF